MKRLIAVFVVALCFACNEEAKVDYTLFSGKIENPKDLKVTILKGREKVKEITLNNNGTFADTLKVEAGFYSLSHGGETSAIYLSPKDNINVTLDTEMFDETIAYTGAGSQNNNYLAAKYMANENANIDIAKLYSSNETEFLSAINDIKNSKFKLLKVQKDLNPEFVSIEEKNIKYDYLSFIQNYPSAHKYYSKNEAFIPSPEFMKPLENLDYKNQTDYTSVESYKNLVKNHYVQKIGEADSPTEVFEFINKEAFPELKNDLASTLQYRIAPNNDDNKVYYEGIMGLSSDEKFKDNLTKDYNKIQKLVKGMPSPKFVNYENHKGGTTSLDDLKGQFIYIDVWATWCGPCIAEIPSLKELEKKYHGKNIAFVSTSIDVESAHDKWVKMVNDKELGGIQLIADNNSKSQFVTDYAINSIPRFLLIDPDGNIVSADAPRPSDPKLIELFNELNI
ncbi:TlpA family protein disulfide reductase [Winogradskyella thalassocola]|uniref:Thiol-disulfide isomerase or thioredoxin n=1 Tax=Winogradskyella thalassocola TaxID=262004 RepID=A0A1G8JL90_9FLAO|nr:TlpA disulfide reductase family protein [Winogradskyella thalassocola]SDI31841.1 Thiol-disulfide isomerase or thioredoxin [Winogradskyella thalassocola]